MKYAKGEVGYEHPARGPHNCGGCVHFQVLAPKHCEIVSGTILAQDWCEKWSPKMTERSAKSPNEINQAQACEARCGEKAAAARTSREPAGIKEHDRVESRTGGKSAEIGLGPNGGGLVPANPFASLAQEGFLHAHPEKLGAKKLAEFDAATKGKKLPKHDIQGE